MNVHPDCQEGVPKCQPKSRLLRRQKSASEIDARVLPGNEDDSKFRFFFSFSFFLDHTVVAKSKIVYFTNIR